MHNSDTNKQRIVEEYVTEKQYPTYYENLNNLRRRIVKDLPIKPSMHILDIGSGYAYFTIEVAKADRNLNVIGVDIAKNDVDKANKNIQNAGLQDRVKILQMDATQLTFAEKEFNIVVNFAGLEDIHMTRGRTGVQKTFLEASRVVISNGYFCFVVMPPEEMETKAQKLEVILYSFMCDATWLSSKEYEQILEQAGLTLTDMKSYYTGKKLTPQQAQCEIRFACENVPKIYGVSTKSFEEVWARFGKDIEKHGLGHYSKVVLMVAQKT
ncbi:MAG: class I SAM-dependent methyltransferase [candidate division WOR-3 bacterium]|nr:MAG: class I SAM-dependent methyltransferase [candidate division WOR-3 bacterium]